jgi:hypothetical protein
MIGERSLGAQELSIEEPADERLRRGTRGDIAMSESPELVIDHAMRPGKI